MSIGSRLSPEGTAPWPLRAAVPERYKRPIKHVYGSLVSSATSFARRNYDPARSILVFGSPRSGTTWLMNLICASPGRAAVFEPLNRVYDPWLARIVGDEWLRLTADADHPELERFFTVVMAGHHLTRWSSNRSSLTDLLRASRLVVKFVRAMRAMGWIARRFPANAKVAILRHPCAVVSSMVASPGKWNDWSREYVTERVLAVVGDAHRPFLARLKTREQLLAAWWAADTRALLTETSPADVLVLTYEMLVCQPSATLERLFSHLGEAVPPGALEGTRRASETANPGAAIRTGRAPLAEWRRRVEPMTARAILDVVEALGVSVYSEALVPDVARLEIDHTRLSWKRSG